MKKLVTIVILCLSCLGCLMAQNIWTDIDYSPIGVAANGDIFVAGVEVLLRSQDEGETFDCIYDHSYSYFLMNKQGRIYLLDNDTCKIWYSDDNGDTWQEQQNGISRNWVDKMYSVSNDTLLLCSNNVLAWTLDGGEVWNETLLPFLGDNSTCVGLLADSAGNVYVGNYSGIYSATFENMTQWDLKAEVYSLKQMEMDSEGNIIVAQAYPHYGFSYQNGVYITGQQFIAVSDNDIVFALRRLTDRYNTLMYSTDHGEHFTPIGQFLFAYIPSPIENDLIIYNDQHLYSSGLFLVDMFDSHLYFYKSILRTDEIISLHRRFAPQDAEWYFEVASNGAITEPPFYSFRMSVTGQEQIQGHNCSVIDGNEYVYQANNVVYWYNQVKEAFTVLYDFDAEAGDSWYCDVDECSYLVTVQSVGSVTFGQFTYRTQYVTAYGGEGLMIPVFDGLIIDGIGYEKGLFPDGSACYEGINDDGEYRYMRCYMEKVGYDDIMFFHQGDDGCTSDPDNESAQLEWYYEILNEDGSITYQHLMQSGDTVIQDEPTHILVRINTLYDKEKHDEVTHEYIYERDNKVYWWNKTLGAFTVLYDLGAQPGDEWEIKVGMESLVMHVDAVEQYEYEGRTYKMLHVSDTNDLFSGDILCGIGHLTSFFPERLMQKEQEFQVDGIRCFWRNGELVFQYGDMDCDAVYDHYHANVEESDMKEGFQVYPNPTDGVITVATGALTSLQPVEYRITNLMGQTLMTGRIENENQPINVSALPAGMYFITFANETQKFVLKK